MPYKYVLFDVDNTILDFTAAQRKAFFMCFPDADERTFDIYETINTGCWQRLERGEATRPQILHDRFALFFEKMGIAGDADEMNVRYLDMLSRVPAVVPGAQDALQKISKIARLAVVTNGVTHVQQRRLRDSGLDRYFVDAIVSEQVGVDKPDIRIFREAVRRIGAESPGEVLLIGDSLTADIGGGANAGLDTCWFNPRGLPLTGGVKPTYVTESPSEWYDVAAR